MMENTSILKYSENNSLVKINRQIQIVNKLLAHVNRDKVIQFLSRNELFFSQLISRHFPFNETLLSKYSDDLDWGHLGISRNPEIIWNKLSLIKFSERLSWVSVSWYSKYPNEVIASNYSKPVGLSLNQHLNWSIDFIELNLNNLDFNYLSGNPALPWTFNFIERYKDKWDWDSTKSLIFSLSKNPGLPWSEELIDKYIDKWDWELLSANKGLPWDINFIEKYTTKWKWGIGGLSKNPALPWTISLIERFMDKWNWGEIGLSQNEGLPWSIQLLRRYKNKWNEKGLSQNNGILWSESMIDEVKSWGYTSINPYSTRNSPWSIDYLIKNEDHISFHMIFEFENLWDSVFKNILDAETIVTLIESNRSKKSYKKYESILHLDKSFEDFLFRRELFWWDWISQLEMSKLEEYYDQKKKAYNYINSEQAFNDLLNKDATLKEIKVIADKNTPLEIEEILSRKIKPPEGPYIFSQKHEMLAFLKSKIQIPQYLKDTIVIQNKISNQSKLVNWFKNKFS